MTYKTTAAIGFTQCACARLVKDELCLENLSFFEAPDHINAQFETRSQRSSDWAFDFYTKRRCRYS